MCQIPPTHSLGEIKFNYHYQIEVVYNLCACQIEIQVKMNFIYYGLILISFSH